MTFSHACQLVEWSHLNDKNIVIKINPFGIYEITGFPWKPIMQFGRMEMFGDSKEQFGTHEKFPQLALYMLNV